MFAAVGNRVPANASHCANRFHVTQDEICQSHICPQRTEKGQYEVVLPNLLTCATFRHCSIGSRNCYSSRAQSGETECSRRTRSAAHRARRPELFRPIWLRCIPHTRYRHEKRLKIRNHRGPTTFRRSVNRPVMGACCLMHAAQSAKNYKAGPALFGEDF
jgi:hypothetical protein